MAHRKRDPHTASKGSLVRRMEIPSLPKIQKEMDKFTPLSKSSSYRSIEAFHRVVGQPLKINTKRGTAEQPVFLLGGGPDSLSLLLELTEEKLFT